MKSLLCTLLALGGAYLLSAQTCGFDAAHQPGQLSPADRAYFETFPEGNMQKLLKAARQQPVNRQQQEIVVPVVVHIVHNGEAVGTGANLSDDRVRAQIDALNAAFSATNANFGDTPAQWQASVGSAEIRFCLAQLDPDGDATTGITRQQIAVTGTSSNQNNINSVIKPALAWDVTRYVNIYSVGIPGTTAQSGVVGYSYYPTPNVYGTDIDGLVIDYNWLGGPGFGQSGYSTVTHEMGHYLGVYHPFNGNACDFDDGLADTPNMSSPTNVEAVFSCANGFPAGPNTCGDEHMYVNYMDYATDDCYTSFTNDQNTLMRAVLDGTAGNLGFVSRADLVANAASACQLPANNAELISFLGIPDTHCEGDSVYAQVIIRNQGTDVLTSTNLYVTTDFNVPFVYQWTGNLALGERDTITLPAAFFYPGQSYYEVYSFEPNGVPDAVTSNDAVYAFFTTVGSRNLPYEEDAEGETGYPLLDSGLESVNVQGDNFFWQIAQGVSAYGQGNDALLFRNGEGSQSDNPYGTVDALVIPHLDLSGLINPELSFDVAYAPYDAIFSDTLRILAAPGCFGPFDVQLYERGGATLATAPATTSLFIPTATQWRTETISLGAFAGEKSLRLALLNRSFWGNNLFIDNIRVAERVCALAATATASDESAVSAADGSVTVSTTNGTPPYTYQWSNGATTAAQQNLAPGDYSVTVTDATNCQSTAEVTVGAFVCNNFTMTLTGQAIACFGDQTGNIGSTISGNVTAPLTYSWSNGAGTTDLNDLGAGTYALTVTDAGGCTASASFVLQQPGSAVSAAATGSDETALAANDGTATATGTGGTGTAYTYLWNNGASAASLDGLAPGTYCVTVSDANACSASACTTVAAYSCPAVSLAVDGQSLSCADAQDGSASATFSGGTAPFTYLWTNGATTASLSGLLPGTYGVTATDAAGCTASGSTTLTAPAALSLVLTGTDETANQAADGSATATAGGGTLPYSYLWADGSTLAIRQNLAPGTYALTVTDANGCTTVGSVAVQAFGCTLSASATASAATCIDAADGSATVSADGNGNLSYSWSTGATTATVTALLPGDYSVTVTDGANCQTVASITVTAVDDTPPVVLTNPISLEIGAEGFVTLDPAQIDAGSSDNCSAVGLQVIPNAFYCASLGDFEVLLTATDAAGNTATANATVTVTSALTVAVTVTQTPSCAGDDDGAVEVTVSGGAANYTLAFSNGSIDPTALAAGDYGLTVTDENGCPAETAFTLTEPAPLAIDLESITAATDGGNNGAIDVTVSGGTPGYVFKWRYNGGIIVSNAEDPSALLPGDYVLELSDQNECTLASATYTVENLTAVTEVPTHGLRVAPNPADTWVYLTADVPFQVRLLDLNRRVVFRNGQADRAHRLRVSGLPAGMYLAEVRWQNGTVLYRRVVVR